MIRNAKANGYIHNECVVHACISMYETRDIEGEEKGRVCRKEGQSREEDRDRNSFVFCSAILPSPNRSRLGGLEM